MDLEKALAQINDSASRHADKVKEAKLGLISAEKEFRKYEGAKLLIEGLRRCEDAHMMASTNTVWCFVAAFELEPRGRMMRPKNLDLIVVPELIAKHKAPRGTPDPVRENVSHWSYVEVDSDNVTAQVLGVERYGLRRGTVEEIVKEPCPTCGFASPIACEHDWDWDSNVQSITLYRLCLRCPDVTVVATKNGDLDDDLTKG